MVLTTWQRLTTSAAIAAALLPTLALGLSDCDLRPGDLIALKSNIGNYVTRRHVDSVPTSSIGFEFPLDPASKRAYWTVVDAGNDKVALQGSLGTYLARVGSSADGEYSDGSYVNVTDVIDDPSAQWTCENAENGAIALKADSGLFLTRASNAKQRKQLHPACSFVDGEIIAFQADTGAYLARTRNTIANATYLDAVAFSRNLSSTFIYWQVVNLGHNQIALKADSGDYLGRCRNCAPGANAGNVDQAFVHVVEYDHAPWAKWRCEDAGNGKVALKADTGSYLSRCRSCISTMDGSLDVAFAQAPGWHTEPQAQFSVVRDVAEVTADAPLVRSDTWRGNWAAQFQVEYIQRKTYCSFRDGQVISLQADNGAFLARSSNSTGANGTFVNSAAFSINQSFPGIYWRVEIVGDSVIALKGDSGTYLARSDDDLALVDELDCKGKPWAQLRCEDATTGKIALRADSDAYLSRGGLGGADVKTNDWHGRPSSQFTVVQRIPEEVVTPRRHCTAASLQA